MWVRSPWDSAGEDTAIYWSRVCVDRCAGIKGRGQRDILEAFQVGYGSKCNYFISRSAGYIVVD